MPNAFQRFGQGLTRTGGGVLSQMAESQDESAQNIKEDKQRELENLIAVMNLQNRLQPEPEEPADTGKWRGIGTSGYIINDANGEVRKAFTPPEKATAGKTKTTKKSKTDENMLSPEDMVDLFGGLLSQSLEDPEEVEASPFAGMDADSLMQVILGGAGVLSGPSSERRNLPKSKPRGKPADNKMRANLKAKGYSDEEIEEALGQLQ